MSFIFIFLLLKNSTFWRLIWLFWRTSAGEAAIKKIGHKTDVVRKTDPSVVRCPLSVKVTRPNKYLIFEVCDISRLKKNSYRLDRCLSCSVCKYNRNKFRWSFFFLFINIFWSLHWFFSLIEPEPKKSSGVIRKRIIKPEEYSIKLQSDCNISISKINNLWLHN